MNSRNISHVGTKCVMLCHRFHATHGFAGIFGYMQKLEHNHPHLMAGIKANEMLELVTSLLISPTSSSTSVSPPAHDSFYCAGRVRGCQQSPHCAGRLRIAQTLWWCYVKFWTYSEIKLIKTRYVADRQIKWKCNRSCRNLPSHCHVNVNVIKALKHMYSLIMISWLW